MTPHQAKKIIREELAKHGLTNNKLTARTVDFTDLAGCSRVFVTIHGWPMIPAIEAIGQAAKAGGFYVEYSRR